jgi:bis(5'-nucleosidyl)-tetraphosphatase
LRHHPGSDFSRLRQKRHPAGAWVAAEPPAIPKQSRFCPTAAMILSAGIIVVRRAEGCWLYLLLRAYDYWDFPKGEVEEGEKPFAAAQREVKEETGLENLSFRWGGVFKETEPYGTKQKTARYYLAVTEEAAVTFSVNPELGRPEHHEFRWLAGDDLRQRTVKRLHPIIAWAREIVEG